MFYKNKYLKRERDPRLHSPMAFFILFGLEKQDFFCSQRLSLEFIFFYSKTS